MAHIIQDEFTMLPISSQRKYQLRRERDGCCRICGAPSQGSPYCAPHRARQNRISALYSKSKHNPQSLI